MAKIEDYSELLAEQKHQSVLKKRLPKKVVSTLLKNLRESTAEKDVENAWRKIFNTYYIDNAPKSDKKSDLYHFSSPYETDGFIAIDDTSTLVFALRLLMEFKNGTDLTKTFDRSRITEQVIHYMKKFSDAGEKLPTVLVGADEDQAFVLLAANFYGYLKGNYNWDCSPSSAYKEDLELMKDLQDDSNLFVYPFQFTVGTFDQKYQSILDLFESIEAIIQANDQSVFKVKVSPATIIGMFDEFNHIAYRNSGKIKPTDSVNLFFQMLMANTNEQYYFLPTNRNKFHLPGDRLIDVFGTKLEAFFYP